MLKGIYYDPYAEAKQKFPHLLSPQPIKEKVYHLLFKENFPQIIVWQLKRPWTSILIIRGTVARD